MRVPAPAACALLLGAACADRPPRAGPYGGGSPRIVVPDGGPPERPPEPLAPGPDSLPAISGGTMAVGPDGRIVVVDPHAGVIARVEPERPSLEVWAHLEPEDEPGRVLGDRDGRTHVVLRRGGALLSLDRALQPIARRPVRAAPRGVAHAPQSDLLYVACASGTLFAFPAEGGPATWKAFLEPDLRDAVVTDDGRVHVSLFRAAELLTLDATGAVVERHRPADVIRDTPGAPTTFRANTAWHIRPMPQGDVQPCVLWGEAGRAPLRGGEPILLQSGRFHLWTVRPREQRGTPEDLFPRGVPHCVPEVAGGQARRRRHR